MTILSGALKAFRTQAAFRAWLQKHHASADELLLRCYKVHAAHRGVTYAQALDEALCFGWIDGIRRSVDQDSFSTRFTPRRPGSIWSNVNVGHVKRLMATGRMAPPGLEAYRAREAGRTGVYSFERQRMPRLPPALAQRLTANARAAAFLAALPPGARRLSLHYVLDAKRPETRLKRLDRLVALSAKGQRLPML